VGTLSDVVSDAGSERRVAESTMEGVWRDVSEDGVFEPETDLARKVSASSIPDGYAVRVEVTVVAPDGSERTAGRVRLSADGPATPPEDAQRASRPVAVQRSPGDVRPGRLVVEVWT